ETLCSFFFSSRRRHTRWPRDWSSDVCSSDLPQPAGGAELRHLFEKVVVGVEEERQARGEGVDREAAGERAVDVGERVREREGDRSEERRVGKECRAGWGAYQ